MGKLPILSGHELIKILKKVGFEPVRQKGSHIVLVNKSAGSKRAVVVPNHKEIDLGILWKFKNLAIDVRNKYYSVIRKSQPSTF